MKKIIEILLFILFMLSPIILGQIAELIARYIENLL